MGVALGGAILGQAMIYHHAAPFVVIFAALVWQKRRVWYGPFMVGGLVGTALGVGWLPALILLAWGLAVPLPWHRPGWQFTKWPLIALGAAAVFGVGQAWDVYFLIIVLSIAAGATLLSYLLLREWDRVLVGDLDRRTLVLGLASLGCLIAGLAGYEVLDVNPSLFLGSLVMLAAAAVQGAAGGAVAGATLGVTLALRGGSPHEMVGILVAGGFLAGWFEVRHWRLASVGLVAGVLVYAIFIELPSSPQTFWISIVAAAILFQVVPETLVALGRQWVESLSPANPADLFKERLTRIADVMKEMARAFRVDEETEPPQTQLVQVVVDTTCKKCSLYRACWEDEFYRSYRAMMELCARAEDVVVKAEDMSGDLARRCIRPDEIARAANLAARREQERASLTLRINESRMLAQLQLTGLAQLVLEMANDMPDESRKSGRHAHVEPIEYRVGLAKRPRRGGVVSGDSELIADLSPTRVVFGLSDGMGVGPRAAWESGTAMSLLEELLRAGFSQALAVRAVNSTLLLRSVDDHFATLDLVLLDREARRMEMVKVAASPTFIRRRGDVFEIRSHALPVGIVPEVTIDPVTTMVESGDVVVMVTDGVLDADPRRGEARLKQFLRELPMADAQMMAETILSFMLESSGDGRDDALVMVILLGRSVDVKRVEEFGESPVREWKRLTRVPERHG
ncbi:MAG: serine/threonine protein phosphatase [Sulfobacillus acidophilus]|uniref:Serine/threonine protein phosphatase n=1 Tax=Sulfobacillus acidophilus TaxID=53633 RepID=A0A2T2WDL9_9FIRM|nr:MAG: serine/threonine protein phosphatase [Sulfobacillus acidophilus]